MRLCKSKQDEPHGTKGRPKPMLQPAQNPANEAKHSATPYTPPKNITNSMEQATIGRSVVIKGDVSGAESLYIDGRIEGTINFDDSRVTVGRNAVVVANVNAKEVIVMGTVTGNIHCADRLDVRSEGSLTGDVVTPRVCIEDGAVVKGSVEVRAAQRQAPQPQNEKPQAKTVEAAKPAEHPKAAAAAASAASSATLAHGSKVMYNESN
jgi:cytoskeletal protein CcmA (bactofilin family)